ncbi:MAG: hypothetical protein JJ895_06760 [Balneolaceae bacterium]|nr:hypothetical protein [Balneolaceae bacterium]
MKISNISPVLPVADIQKEIAFFEKLGFSNTHDSLRYSDALDYAVMTFDSQSIHLQLFADGNFVGQQIKFWVADINQVKTLFEAAKLKGNLHEQTPWGTHELGCYSPTKHALIFVQEIA